MIYSLINWTARAGTRLNRFKKTIEADGYVDLVNDPVEVTQNGTPLSVENLNHMDAGIKGANDDVEALKTTVAGKQSTITGAASSIASANLAASMALVSDASGKVAAHASVSAAELGYLDGVTGAIQTQINARAQVNTNSAAAATSFPFGTILFCYDGPSSNNSARNKTDTVHLDSGFVSGYVTGASDGGKGSQLGGTWRMCGKSQTMCNMQRVSLT